MNTRDSGALDVGTDSTSTDSTATDSTSNDSTTTDAGGADSTATDSSPTDASAIEGATQDASASDGPDGGDFACPAGKARQVATGTNPWKIAVDATNVYWTEFRNHVIRRAPIGGGTIETLANLPTMPINFRPSEIAVDAHNVYWANWDGSSIMRQPKTGFNVDSPILVTQGSAQIGSLAINSSWVVFGEDAYVVWKAPISGGSRIAHPGRRSADMGQRCRHQQQLHLLDGVRLRHRLRRRLSRASGCRRIRWPDLAHLPAWTDDESAFSRGGDRGRQQLRVLHGYQVMRVAAF
jgi:hypothetical protein